MNKAAPAIRPFSLLVKPASADCNLRCAYCFYIGKNLPDSGSPVHRMSEKVLEKMIRGYMATAQPVYGFGWQGGEPTLMGVDFFRKVVDLQKKYGGQGVRVANGFQTNAVLIDDQWAEHLARYRYLVGISLDGPADVHDRYRQTPGGGPSQASVLKGIHTLRRHGVEFNVLVLVSQANVHRAGEIYDYLVDLGITHHQYIPCVEFDDKGNRMPYAITGPQWGDVMCAVFDRWMAPHPSSVSVRNFDATIQKLVDGTPGICSMADDCRQYFVVDHNGDLYPCDFFVDDALTIGNVMDTGWEDAMRSRTYKNFGIQKSRRDPACETCDCLDLCMGDCLKHRVAGGRDARSLSRLCPGIRQIVRHVREPLSHMAEDIRIRQIRSRQQRLRSAKGVSSNLLAAGRNQPCLCGSGLKFKKCCGR